jgi:hypothetical protein
LEKKKKTRANVAYDRRRMTATVPSAAENPLQVKGPREGKKKTKNNHSFHLPHGGGGDNGDNEQKKKKKKKRVDFVLTMEQQRSTGTHFPRKRPHSL